LKKLKNFYKLILLKKILRGTIIISDEGINGTLSANKKNLNLVIKKIKNIFQFEKFDSENLSMSKFNRFTEERLKLKKKLFQWELKYQKEK